jgi:hypothetical protein
MLDIHPVTLAQLELSGYHLRSYSYLGKPDPVKRCAAKPGYRLLSGNARHSCGHEMAGEIRELSLP